MLLAPHLRERSMQFLTAPLSWLCTVLLLPIPATQSPPSLAAQVPERGKLEVLAKEALENPRAYAMLAELCAVAPKRLSGSKGAAAAVQWGQKTMLSLGLENVRLEPCMVPHWERGTLESLVLVSASGAAPERLSVCSLGGSPPTPADGIEAEIVMVKSFEELEGLGERARGKAVFFNRPMDPVRPSLFQAYGGAVDQRSRGSAAAAKAGALCAIVRSMTLALDDHPHTGAMRYEKDACVPTVAISTLGAERLATLLSRGETPRVKLDLDCRWYEDAPSFNVVGEILGHEKPEEIVLVGGHLDAWDLSVGAHDDGAGCVQALEVMRLIKTLGWKPRRTLRVILWMNEENGLRGATGYRDTHREKIDRHVFALESDRGGFAPRGFESNSTGADLARLAAIGEQLRPYGIQYVSHSTGVGADVGPLHELGVPCAGFIPESARYFDVHHSALDTLESVHPRELQLGALCMAYLCFSVAEFAEPLGRVTPAPATQH